MDLLVAGRADHRLDITVLLFHSGRRAKEGSLRQTKYQRDVDPYLKEMLIFSEYKSHWLLKEWGPALRSLLSEQSPHANMSVLFIVSSYSQQRGSGCCCAWPQCTGSPRSSPWQWCRSGSLWRALRGSEASLSSRSRDRARSTKSDEPIC